MALTHVGREVADEATQERARRKFADPEFRNLMAKLAEEQKNIQDVPDEA